MKPRQELWLSLILTTILIVLMGFAFATFFNDTTEQPEAGWVVHGVGQATTTIKIEELLRSTQVEWGLNKIQVDGCTFLLWRTGSGAAIVEYEPKAVEATP